MTCNRVLILRQGRILAADTPDNLQKVMASNNRIIVEIAAPEAALREVWAATPEIEQYDVAPAEGEFLRCALMPRDGADLRGLVFAIVRDHGWVLRELTRNRHSLEDIYLQVTRPLEEDEA